MTVDYSTQVEHRQPWARLLVPTTLASNITLLRSNTGRLISAFDLHETLRGAMLHGPGTPGAATCLEDGVACRMASGQPAAVDLLNEAVPALRTCHEARIPELLCPCQSERLSTGGASYAPSWDTFKGDQGHSLSTGHLITAWQRGGEAAGK